MAQRHICCLLEWRQRCAARSLAEGSQKVTQAQTHTHNKIVRGVTHMGFFFAVTAGLIIAYGAVSLLSIFTSLNELKDIVEQISKSTEKIKSVSDRIERNYG